MDDKIKLADKLQLLDKPFNPGIVGYLNDYKLAVVKVHGEFVWHKHDETDDFFLVLSGRMTIQLRERDVELAEGELFVVPRGVEHRPRADEEAHVLLIEPRGTANTGRRRRRAHRRGALHLNHDRVVELTVATAPPEPPLEGGQPPAGMTVHRVVPNLFDARLLREATWGGSRRSSRRRTGRRG